MLDILEDIIIVVLIIWFVDHIIFRGKDSTRFWITLDFTLVFIFVLRWIINIFL